jgi:hypothetical protein
VKVYQRTSLPSTLRSRAPVTALLDGYQLVDPGVVYVPDWQPDTDTAPDTLTSAFVGSGTSGEPTPGGPASPWP